MPDPATEPSAGLEEIHKKLQLQEERLARLEAYMGLAPPSAISAQGVNGSAAPVDPGAKNSERLELRFGEFGLAWVGGIIFILGIIFLMAYTYSLGHEIAGSSLGFLSAIGLFFLARLWEKSIPYVSRLTVFGSLVLLYYSTVRMHFFSSAPLIPDSHVELILLLGAVSLMLVLAIRRHSQPTAFLAIFFGMTTAILVDSTQITLTLVVAFSLVAVTMARRWKWPALASLAIPLAYGVHLAWLLGNPLMGRPLSAVTDHQYSLIYLFCCAAVLACPTFFFTGDSSQEPVAIAQVLLNCLGFCSLLFLTVFALFREDFAWIYFAAALLLLVLAVLQWLVTRQQFAPAFYASFGFMALSAALYAYAGIPNAFLWLALQSLLVVTMALWFRSKMLVVMNSLIFISILVAYLFVSATLDAANFGFALVAHASARVMNWQKERLTLRTRTMRNVYLLIAFVFMMYAIYHALPNHFRSLGWTGAAIVYFLLSLALRNIKYRWMAMAALLITVLNLFLSDLRYLDPLFRFVAFLGLGIIAVFISLFYSKLQRFLATGEPDDEA